MESCDVMIAEVQPTPVVCVRKQETLSGGLPVRHSDCWGRGGGCGDVCGDVGDLHQSDLGILGQGHQLGRYTRESGAKHDITCTNQEATHNLT